MQKTLKLLALTLFLSLFSASTNYSNASNLLPQPEKVDYIIIDIIDIGLHDLSWSSMTGNSPYQVTIFNLTTSTLHSQFNTSATSGYVYGLTVGHTYAFSVTRGATTQYIIDIIDL